MSPAKVLLFLCSALTAVAGNLVNPFILGSTVDVDAAAYFTRASVTDATQKTNISSFITGLKAAGLYNDLGFLVLYRAHQNKGTGSTIYEFHSNTYNGTIAGSPTWNNTGLIITANDQWVDFPGYSMTMNHDWTSGVVIKQNTYVSQYARIFGGKSGGSTFVKPTIMYLLSANPPNPATTGIYDGASGVAPVGGNLTVRTHHALTYKTAATAGLVSYSGASTISTQVNYTSGVGTHTLTLSSGGGANNEQINPSDVTLMYVYPNRKLTLAEYQTINGLLKTTICSDLSLP